MAVLTTPAVLLRMFPYSESSQVLWFQTESEGRINALARGARRAKGGHAGNLQLFGRGLLTVHVRSNRDLQTFQDFSLTRSPAPIGQGLLRFAGASVVAELILRHGGEAPSSELFHDIDRAFTNLGEVDDDRAPGQTLVECWQLIDVLGYRPSVDACPECGEPFLDGQIGQFDFAAGGVLCEDCGAGREGPKIGPGARDNLQSFLRGEVPDGLGHITEHFNLLDNFVTYHLSSGKPLETVRFLRQLMP